MTESAMREWLTEILDVPGYHLFTAGDGLEARSQAIRHALDLVITDISMPMSGKDPEILMAAKFLGAHAALRKPITSEMILQCVGDLSPM
jgi:DNA-binding NtrC family response regulator